MKPPVLSIQTVYFHDSDLAEARRFGGDLYEKLSRPAHDPLGHGPAIPVRVGVRADRVDPRAADTTVLIPVLGKETYLTMGDEVVTQLAEWHRILGPGHVLSVPVSENWRNREGDMPGKQFLTMLYGKGDPRARTLDEIILAIVRVWEPGCEGVKLFISHAKADLAATEDAATKIHDYVVTDGTGKAFFDATGLHAGESTGGQLDEAAGNGVLVSIRGDSYGSRAWCQRELLRAKLRGVPTLTVEVLRKGELRSFPYGGNSPSVVWDKNPATVVSQAMVEWLRTAYFRREAARIIDAADLPDDVRIVARPPELLDLAQGPLRFDRAQLVLHPDPELSVLERRVLKAAMPRMHLATPTTAFRRLLSRRDETADVSSPLEGRQIGMSLSDSPAEDGPDGFTRNHTIDATVYVARTLISCGAAIAYGGDFRKGSYTELLANLIQIYNQTATKRAQDLHSYLAAIVAMGDIPDNLPLALHHLSAMPEWKEKAILPAPPATPPVPAPLYFSDMRRVMEDQISARVILGGNTIPNTEKGPGYGGRYPGVVEEAWWTLSKGKPLYVLGGFGGAAAIVADLIHPDPEQRATHSHLLDDTWKHSDLFVANAGALEESGYISLLGIPKNMAELATSITGFAERHLVDDDAALAWNGLSVEENLLLFRTRDPVTITALVSKGILQVARVQEEGLLHIELVNDSIGTADNLDAIAIATVEGVPLGGAGAALDHLTGGTASNARSRGRVLASLQDSPVDADWLYLASLGKPSELGELRKGIEKAAQDTAAVANKHGFQRLGLVTFGGNLLPDAGETAAGMIEGFSLLERSTALVWYETDERRFDRLCKILENEPRVKLTTRRALSPIIKPEIPPEPLILTVRLEGDQLSATLLPPAAGATVAVHVTQFSSDVLSALSAGTATPRMSILEERGADLASHLFGNQGPAVFNEFRESRMIVVHDVASSRLPFEMLLVGCDLRPALNGGITRKLSVSGAGYERQFPKPARKGRLRVLMISDPNEDLPGARNEASVVKGILKRLSNVDLIELTGEDASRANVTRELAEADILHYCGHAYFRGEGDDQSGLILADGDLTGTDLRGIDPLPRMAFVNACEAGRVRGNADSTAAAFAELFLRSGVDAYLGTFWEVGDEAAMVFAERVYTSLASGKTLEGATLDGRKSLFEKSLPDWANYMLFGGGYYRLVSQT